MIHVTKRITIVIIVLLTFIPTRASIAAAISGVATEKVVAVPAIRANTARRSMILPMIPSVYFPRSGRQASENFCLSLFLT